MLSPEQLMVLERLYQRLDEAVTIEEQERISTAIRKLEAQK